MAKKTLSKAYNPEVDLWKLCFAIVVFLFHANKIANGNEAVHWDRILFSRGYIAVEFFFMISGYFMAAKIQSDEKKGLRTPTAQFIKHKIQSFYKIFFVAFLISFVGREILGSVPFLTASRDLLLSTSEIGLFRLFGLGLIKYYNGPTWYISAMMIALIVLYPLAARFRRPFFTVACPAIAFFCYAVLRQTLGKLATTEDVLAGGLIVSGVVRAFAGLAVGAFINECCTIAKEKNIRPTRIGNVVFILLEVCSIALIFFYMNFAGRLKWNNIYDFSIIPVIAFFLFIVFSEFTGIKQLLQGLDLSILSELSLYLYLNHRLVTYILIKNIPGGGSSPRYLYTMALYFGMTVCIMVLCRLIILLFDLFAEKLLPRIKTLFFIKDHIV